MISCYPSCKDNTHKKFITLLYIKSYTGYSTRTKMLLSGIFLDKIVRSLHLKPSHAEQGPEECCRHLSDWDGDQDLHGPYFGSCQQLGFRVFGV